MPPQFSSTLFLLWLWRLSSPYLLTFCGSFPRKKKEKGNDPRKGLEDTSIPRAGERIQKVTKKSGNRGRCRKLSLWSSTHRATVLFLLNNGWWPGEGNFILSQHSSAVFFKVSLRLADEVAEKPTIWSRNHSCLYFSKTLLSPPVNSFL